MPPTPKLTTYRYNGPVCAVTLTLAPAKPEADGKEATPAETQELTLHPGESYELPADVPYVANLVELGHLTEVPQPAEPPKANAKTQKEIK